MPVYHYQASDRTGKLHQGSREAKDPAGVIRWLQEQGLYPIKVETKPDKAGSSISFKPSDIFGRVRSGDIVQFTSNLATLINAGLPLERCLTILTELTTNKRLQVVVGEVLRNIQGGSTFADALGRHPRYFPKVYINMVRAGEAGGVLDSVLARLAKFMEEAEEMKGQVANAMVYPAFLTFVGGGAVIVLLTVVLPKFEPMFEDMGVAMPAMTQFILDVSKFVRGYWWLLLGMIGGAWYGFTKYISTPVGRDKWDGFQLALPVFGDLITKVEVARFTRTLGTLSHSGVPLLNALNIVRELLNNIHFERAVSKAYDMIKEGGGVAKPLSKSGLFPAMAIHMMEVGEETGRLEEMLLKVAEVYDIEVRNALKRAMALIEPAMIIIMGLVVGFIVVAMILAIMSMNSMEF